MTKNVPIVFGYKVIFFFILLELSTVPLVAMSNSFAIKSIQAMAAMGFFVALIAVYVLLHLLNRYIINNSPKLLNMQIDRVRNIWYVCIISGILEMVMFVVQDFLFSYSWRDYSTGFWSAFISVGVALVIYKTILSLTGFGVGLVENQKTYKIDFPWLDIFKLSFLFGMYELVVCPITGWWIPFLGWQRIAMAIFSAIVGASLGAILLVFLTKKIKYLQSSLFIIS